MADDAEQVVPLVAKETELEGPKVFALFPFCVDDVLKLKEAEKKCGRAHCIGPVIQLAIWSPLIHASVMFSFMGLGVLHMWQETTSRTTLDTEITYPTYWWFLAFFGCMALMYLEVHIAKYQSISYSDKARKQFQKKNPDRFPISWPCLPVTVIDTLLCRHELQENWYFNAWFCWHFVLGMVTLYGRVQANTFIGMLLYGFLADALPVAVNKIWDDTMTHSFMARGQSVPLTAILLFMFIAQISHYLFGVLNYCPRRNWKTADHLRWQSDEWQAWGRSFEFEVKGMRKQEERITEMSEWDKWRDGFDGAQAMASGADGMEFHLTVPRGGPVYKTQDKVEYKPSDEDLPLTIKWVSNRHAYTNVLGEEMTSSTAMDVIAECCSMGIMAHMQALELDEYKKAEEALSKYKGETDPTIKSAGELISEVRMLMNDAVNVTRCAFSRVFLYGLCFVGIHLHFQVSYTNVVCASKQEAGGSEQCARAESLLFGIVAAFMSMLLVLEKIFKITMYHIHVWAVFREYTSSLSQTHKELKQFKAMQGQISTAKRSLLAFSIFFFPLSFMFVWNFVWLSAKWYMETTVCPTVGSRMWNIPAWSNILDLKSGCVEL